MCCTDSTFPVSVDHNPHDALVLDDRFAFERSDLVEDDFALMLVERKFVEHLDDKVRLAAVFDR